MAATLLPSHMLAARLLGDLPTGRPATASDALTRIPLGTPGRCPATPTQLIVLFDNSASVFGGNDPAGNRFAETRHALTRVGPRCRCRRELASILSFDTPTSGDVLPRPIAGDLAGFGRGLAIPRDARGSSVLGPGLSRATELAQAKPDHRSTLLVFSDFELLDPGIPEVLARLGDFPGTVHAIVLRATPQPDLVQNPNINVISIDRTAPQGAVARAVFDGLTLHRPRRSLWTTTKGTRS